MKKMEEEEARLKAKWRGSEKHIREGWGEGKIIRY